MLCCTKKIEVRLLGAFVLISFVIVAFGVFWIFQLGSYSHHLKEEVPDRIAAIELETGANLSEFIDLSNRVNKEIKQTTYYTIYWVVFILLLIILAEYLTLKSVIFPIRRITEGARKIAAGDWGYQIKEESDDELGVLADALRQMTATIAHSRKEVASKGDELAKVMVSIRSQNDKLGDVRKAMLNVLEDVDEEKRVAVRHAQKNDLILRSMEDGVCVVDSAGLIVFINDAGKKILGKEHDVLVGLRIIDVLDPHNKDEAVVDKEQLPIFSSMHHKRTVRSGPNFRVKHEQGHFIEAELVASPLVTDGIVEGAIAVFRDVTKAREVDRMKSEFVSVASHQLRTPLTAIRWYNEMLLDGDLGAIQDNQKESLSMMHESVIRMIDLVNALLNVARIESGRIQVNPEPTDLRELIKTIVQEYNQRIEEKDITLTVSVASNMEEINIDPSLVGEVYANLITNAIKYTPEGGDVTVFVSMKEDMVVSQVTDTGYGIPAHQQAKIFKKFFRAENIISKDTDGTGLGLYITKAIVESSGGKIWFSSEEGKGTSFWFTIPKTGMIEHKGDRKLAGAKHAKQIIQEKKIQTQVKRAAAKTTVKKTEKPRDSKKRAVKSTKKTKK